MIFILFLLFLFILLLVMGVRLLALTDDQVDDLKASATARIAGSGRGDSTNEAVDESDTVSGATRRHATEKVAGQPISAQPLPRSSQSPSLCRRLLCCARTPSAEEAKLHRLLELSACNVYGRGTWSNLIEVFLAEHPPIDD